MRKKSESGDSGKENARFLKTEGLFSTRSEANRRIMGDFLKGSHKVGKTTEITNYFYFSEQTDALLAAEDLGEIGFTMDDPIHTEGNSKMPWLLLCWIDLVLDDENMNRLNEFLDSIAEKYNGNYGGWEMAVNKEDIGMFLNDDETE